MATTVLQVRLDSDIKKDADAFFADFGLSTAKAVRRFIDECLQKRDLPFEAASEEDPFYSEANMKALEESIARFEVRGGTFHDLIEVE
jgi:DNA-damage-inducible protein J